LAENSSDIFLVRGSLQLLEPEMSAPETLLLMSVGAGVARSWTADQDYFITGWNSAVAGNSTCVISLSGMTATTVYQAQTTVGDVIGVITTAVMNLMPNRKIPLPKNAVLRLFNGAVSVIPVVIYLEPTVLAHK
jgi:hypothetical protein